MCTPVSISECCDSGGDVTPPKGVCDESSQEMTLFHFIIDAPHIKSTEKNTASFFSRGGGGARGGGAPPVSSGYTNFVFGLGA